MTKRGFTLLEMLLSVAIIALIAGMGVPVYQSFQNRNELDIAANALAQSLHRAQVLSQNQDGDSSWGVHIATGTITVFQGNSFASRDAEFDEVSVIPSSMMYTGTDEYVFSELFATTTMGTTTLTSINNESRSIVVNERGRVEY